MRSRNVFVALEMWKRSIGSTWQKISSRISLGISFIISKLPGFKSSMLWSSVSIWPRTDWEVPGVTAWVPWYCFSPSEHCELDMANAPNGVCWGMLWYQGPRQLRLRPRDTNVLSRIWEVGVCTQEEKYLWFEEPANGIEWKFRNSRSPIHDLVILPVSKLSSGYKRKERVLSSSVRHRCLWLFSVLYICIKVYGSYGNWMVLRYNNPS